MRWDAALCVAASFCVPESVYVCVFAPSRSREPVYVCVCVCEARVESDGGGGGGFVVVFVRSARGCTERRRMHFYYIIFWLVHVCVYVRMACMHACVPGLACARHQGFKDFVDRLGFPFRSRCCGPAQRAHTGSRRALWLHRSACRPRDRRERGARGSSRSINQVALCTRNTNFKKYLSDECTHMCSRARPNTCVQSSRVRVCVCVLCPHVYGMKQSMV